MLSGKRQVDFGLARDTPCRAFKQNFPRRWWGFDQRPQELPNRTARPVDVFNAVQCGCSNIASPMCLARHRLDAVSVCFPARTV